MRKIENEKDWNKFVADVEYHLGEECHYRVGAFVVSKNGDDVDATFFTEFDVDSDGYYWLNPLFKNFGSDDWESARTFFKGLSANYGDSFYIDGARVKYEWI